MALLKKYEDIFAEGLGIMKHFQATLKVRPGTTPVFHRPRPIPFAVKDAVDKELERLQQGVILMTSWLQGQVNKSIFTT